MAVMKTAVLHIHPTRMCNLACAHCYSTSGPAQRGHLPLDAILTASASLRDRGYTQASLSGGEPMLYPEIDALCRGLTEQGYAVSVISNGWFPERVLPLSVEGAIRTTSISFDGTACLHDRIRGRKGAFDKALSCLRALVKAGQKAGAVVAVTRAGLPQLPDLVALLVQDGVGQILFHPVAAVGRARAHPDTCTELDEEQLLRLLLLTQAFGQLYPEVPFGCDAATGMDIRASDLGREGDLITPLILDEEGRFFPLAYGIAETLSLGSLAAGIAPPVVTPDLARLIAATQETCATRYATAFYPELVARSHAPA
jgi:MoaA/NifB/PqqE/SkfB family radical SAM enzyme